MNRIAETLAQNGIEVQQGLHDHSEFSDLLCFEPPCFVGSLVRTDMPLSVGAFTHINGGFIQNANIGRYCSIARDVQIGHGGHPTQWLSVSPLQYISGYRNWEFESDKFHDRPSPGTPRADFAYGQVTEIGNDVWLGNHVFIKDGVTIGDGAVVGAHAVVTQDVPAYAIVAGAPAREIRRRFSAKTVERLVRLKWWNYRITEFPIADFADIDRAIEIIEDTIESGEVSPYAPPKFYPKLLQQEVIG